MSTTSCLQYHHIGSLGERERETQRNERPDAKQKGLLLFTAFAAVLVISL
jgi:hypothetical protein